MLAAIVLAEPALAEHVREHVPAEQHGNDERAYVPLALETAPVFARDERVLVVQLVDACGHVAYDHAAEAKFDSEDQGAEASDEKLSAFAVAAVARASVGESYVIRAASVHSQDLYPFDPAYQTNYVVGAHD